MKALLFTAFALFSSSSAYGDKIESGGAIGFIVRQFSGCEQCMAMEDLRTQKFAPANRDLHKVKLAKQNMRAVYSQADRLGKLSEEYAERNRKSNIAENNAGEFCTAHLNEIRAFYFLAAEAMPFDQELQLAERIAYFNQELKCKDIYESVVQDAQLNETENLCVSDFFKKAVAYKECTSDEDGNEEAPAPKRNQSSEPKQKCKFNASVEPCKAAQARRRSVR